MIRQLDLENRERFKSNKVVEGAHVHEVLTELPLIHEYFLSVISSTSLIVDNMFGLVAQSGRAPGFYSTRISIGMKRYPMVEGSNPSEPVCIPGR